MKWNEMKRLKNMSWFFLNLHRWHHYPHYCHRNQIRLLGALIPERNILLWISSKYFSLALPAVTILVHMCRLVSNMFKQDKISRFSGNNLSRLSVEWLLKKLVWFQLQHGTNTISVWPNQMKPRSASVDETEIV